ncbi:Phosphotyrosyl phosphatase activator [Neoconidiobolus thromboides FSU 785]|nr:Phosphotyrosyl phosphatase activator [Neoconidiobolus thromboides FSU 785]
MMFKVPIKTILTKEDLEQYQESSAYKDYVDFILKLNDSVIGKKTTEEIKVSELVKNILNVLDKLYNLVDNIPPEEVGKSRFGNPAFKTWYNKVKELIPELLKEFIEPKESIVEISKYLYDSFGDYNRIDYGTGHEVNFMCFLLCLKKLNLISEVDYPSLILKVFHQYIKVMRKLQFIYWLEPAGSHGVWGLDDYHFLPFLFGSAQLINHPHFRPKCIHDNEIVEEFSQHYEYLACIQFVNSVKSESLRWHSPMLDDISGVKTWLKVNQGMIKMYLKEVLNKLPIVQHFLFGTLINFETGHIVPENHNENEHAHVYAFGQEHPSCCSVRIPSAIGAKSINHQSNTLPTRLPFD